MPSKYRGQQLESALKAYGVAYTRIAGIEPSQLDSLDVRALRISSRFSIIPPLTPSEICCAYGHKLIYSQILDGVHEWALILEDDAILRIDPKLIKLHELDSNLPLVLQLSPDPYEYEFSALDSPDEHIPDTKLIKIRNPQLETCAYLMNKAAAKIILEKVKPNLITSRADWPLEALGNVNFMKTKVFCAYQIKLHSKSLIRDKSIEIPRVSLVTQLLRAFVRFTGVTALLYSLNGAPFRAAYRVEVTLPLIKKLSRLKS